MEEFEITRQHDETSMTEIVGQNCERFIAVCNNDEMYNIFYLELSNVYHRFFLDAGLLFWRSGENPDEEDDLYGGDRYVDLGREYDLVGSSVASIIFQNDRLEMKFSNDVSLSFEGGVDDVGARMIR